MSEGMFLVLSVVIGLLEVAGSLWAARKQVEQTAISIFVVPLAGFAVLMMASGTLVPFYIVVLCLPIVTSQLLMTSVSRPLRICGGVLFAIGISPVVVWVIVIGVGQITW